MGTIPLCKSVLPGSLVVNVTETVVLLTMCYWFYTWNPVTGRSGVPGGVRIACLGIGLWSDLKVSGHIPFDCDPCIYGVADNVFLLFPNDTGDQNKPKKPSKGAQMGQAPTKGPRNPDKDYGLIF